MRVTIRPTASLALVVAVVCVLAAAAAGAFAPAAAAAPDAAQIDDFLAAHGSPMTGTGATFAAEGREHGVDPAFLVAIAGAETSFGELLYSENGDQCTYNAFNWFFGPTWPQSDFGSWDEAIGRVAARPRRRALLRRRPLLGRAPSRRATARTAPATGSATSRPS